MEPGSNSWVKAGRGLCERTLQEATKQVAANSTQKLTSVRHGDDEMAQWAIRQELSDTR